MLIDSGGIQEEAPGLGKYVLVIFNTIVRYEVFHAGKFKLLDIEKPTTMI